MWESRVLCEISKALWKPLCGFHRDVISTPLVMPSLAVVDGSRRGPSQPAPGAARCGRPPSRATWSSVRAAAGPHRLPRRGERPEVPGASRDREPPVEVLTDAPPEPGATPATGLGRHLEDVAANRDRIPRDHAVVLTTEDRVEVDRPQRYDRTGWIARRAREGRIVHRQEVLHEIAIRASARPTCVRRDLSTGPLAVGVWKAQCARSVYSAIGSPTVRNTVARLVITDHVLSLG